MVKHEVSGERTGDDSQSSWDSVTEWAKEHPFSRSHDIPVPVPDFDDNPEPNEGDSASDNVDNVSVPVPDFEDDRPDFSEETEEPLDNTPEISDDYVPKVGDVITLRPESEEFVRYKDEIKVRDDVAWADSFGKRYGLLSSLRGGRDYEIWKTRKLESGDGRQLVAEVERLKKLMDCGLYELPPLEGSPDDEALKKWRERWEQTVRGGEYLDRNVRALMRVNNSEDRANDEVDPTIAADPFFADPRSVRVGNVFNYVLENGEPSPEALKFVAPILKKLETDESKDKIEELTRTFDKEKIMPFLRGSIDFFAKLYGLKEYPMILFIEGETTSGFYNHSTNVLGLNIKNRTNAAEYLDTIAHELWHARQAQSIRDGDIEARLLSVNNDAYVSPDENYASYRAQLNEVEAWAIGRTVGRIANPPMMERFSRGFKKPFRSLKHE